MACERYWVGHVRRCQPRKVPIVTKKTQNFQPCEGPSRDSGPAPEKNREAMLGKWALEGPAKVINGRGNDTNEQAETKTAP